jgi:hypothetical protein
MRRTRAISGVVVLACLLLFAAAPTASLACGYHDPQTLARGMLNWSFPDALHVTGAVWSAQQAGELAMPDRERLQARGEARKHLDEEALRKATLALHAVGEAIESADTDGPDVAIVLIDPMLWTRFVHAGDGEHLGVVSHADGPRDGDLVIVTDEPVLHAIESGELSIAEANRKGYLRLYSTPEQEVALLEAYGALGDQPLPEVSTQTMLRRGRLGLALQEGKRNGPS